MQNNPLFDMLLNQVGGSIASEAGKKLGIENKAAQSALGSIVPVLVNAMARNSRTKEGAESLTNALSKDHDGSFLDNLGGFLSNADQGPGAGILKHVLGGKRQSVEQTIGQQSGLSGSNIGAMMEMVAPILMGYLGKQQRGSSGGGSVIDILQGATNDFKQQAPKDQSFIEKMIDSDGDGSIADDVTNIGMKWLGKFLKRK